MGHIRNGRIPFLNSSKILVLPITEVQYGLFLCCIFFGAIGRAAKDEAGRKDGG